MSELEPEDREIIENRIRRATGISALRKIGTIVAGEERADAEKSAALRWMLRYGWLVVLATIFLFGYHAGVL